MALTNEVKQQYVNAIEIIWQGSMRNNTVDNIDDNVVRLMDSVLSEISKGTYAFLAVDVTYSIFYDLPSSWLGLLVWVAQNALGETFQGWFNVIFNNRKYRAVINAAALNFKSPVQLALYGL